VSKFSKDNETRLTQLLGQELEAFQRIRELTAKQTEFIAADDVTAFEKSLDDRQKFIEKIDGLHQESDILMQSYLSFTGSADGKKSDRIEDLNVQIRAVLAECAEMNDRNMSAAKKSTQEYTEQIGKLSKGRKSIGAYAQGITNKSELIDKKM